jgi:hypothetical protein
VSAGGERHVFAWSAAAALGAHALLLLSTDGVYGGGDLKPHLRLIQLMAGEPGLRTVYAPAYHVLGALTQPFLSLSAYAECFAWCSAAALIFGFRAFQRAAGLPDVAAALFAWSPYHFALTTCLPKVEAAGYALTLVGLALLLRKRHVAVALCLAATFCVHTAAALLLGLVGGVLALVERDRNGILALAAGTGLALPLPLAHLAADCTLPQALLFSQHDYLRAAPNLDNLLAWDRILSLANPIALVAAGFGARAFLAQSRTAAIVCGLLAILYLNELWLAPFGIRTTLDLLRGLTVLSIPLAAAAGIAVARDPRIAIGAVVASAAVVLGTTLYVVPDSCVSKPIDTDEIHTLSVDRCQFRWRMRQPATKPEPLATASGSRAELAQISADRVGVGPFERERAAQ